MGSLGGLRWLLVEPLIGRSVVWGLLVEPLIGRGVVRCVPGREFPVPDEVAAAAYVFLVLPGGVVFWYARLGGVVF